MGRLPLIALLSLAGALGSVAQETQPAAAPPTTTAPQPVVPQPPAEGPLATAEARLAEIRDNTELDEETRTRLTESYQRAAEDLRKAQALNQQREQFEQTRQEAPERLKVIREALAQATTQPAAADFAELSLTDLEQALEQARAQAEAARKADTDLAAEATLRQERRSSLPVELATARQALETTQTEIAGLSPEDAGPTAVARRFALEARRNLLQSEIQALEAEAASYDARSELLRVRRDKAARDLAQAEARVKTLQDLVSERRRTEAEKAAREAARQARTAALAHPSLKELADTNAELAARRTEIEERVVATQKAVTETTALSVELKNALDSVEGRLKRVAAGAGLTQATGLQLRRQLENLPPLQARLRDLARTQAAQAKVDLAMFELDEDLERLRKGSDELIEEVLASVEPGVGAGQREEIRVAAGELLAAQAGYINDLYGAYGTYQQDLSDLYEKQAGLIRLLRDFRALLRENILWTRSTTLPRVADLEHAADGLAWLLTPANWQALPAALLAGAQRNPGVILIGAPLWLALLLTRRRLRRGLRALGAEASRPYATSLAPTLAALAGTLALVVFWPALIFGAGWLLESDPNVSDFGRSLGAALRFAAALVFSFAIVSQLCRDHGLAQDHFGWSEESTRFARTQVAMHAWPLTTLAGVVVLTEVSGNTFWQNALGRAAFVPLMLLGTMLLRTLMRPSGPLLAAALRAPANLLAARLAPAWYTVLVAGPLLLAVCAIAGYYYTAIRLSQVFGATLLLALGVWIGYEVMQRWLLVSRRHLALEQYRRKREAAAAAAEGGEKQVEPPPDLTQLSAQTERLLRIAMRVAFLVGLWLVWNDVLPALGILDSVRLWSSSAEDGTFVTLQDIGLAALILFVTWLAAVNLPGVIEITLLQRTPLQAGTRYAITTVARYAITAVGLVLGFQMIGVGWSKVQWLVAALGVGLGFGLQEIFANFVSGLIILFERPVRVGDTVSVGNLTGTVTRIRIRATTITDWDRKELIIPNKEFVTGQVVNWTLTDNVIRIIVPVGVAYGSNTQLVEQTLLSVAQDSQLVMEDPSPRALFLGFGDSALNFDLRVFIDDMSNLLTTRHQLHMEIDRRFRELGIEISFPQRDIHIRSIRDVLQAQLPAQGELRGEVDEPAAR